MKRIVVASILLVICVSISWLAIEHTQRVNDTVSSSVSRALEAMSRGDMDTLQQEVGALSEFWEKEEDHMIHLVRHSQIDEITKSVARLQALAEGEHYAELAAELASIRWQMDHINRSERRIFTNLL